MRFARRFLRPTPVIPRLSVVVIGQGVTENSYRLFGKLRQRGTYFYAGESSERFADA